MATGSPTAQQPAVPLRYRPSVSDLTEQQLADFRAAFAALQAINDDRGYQYLAGLHGLPLPMWCDVNGHGKPTFLHWHRAYLYRFELALRATGHDVMLAWWDWYDDPTVPTAYSDPTDAAGNTNPLYSVHINDLAIQQALAGQADPDAAQLAGTPDTFRDPGLQGTQMPTRPIIDAVLALDSFADFTDQLESWHGQVHVWTGGHMTNVPLAAYDPIFWAHHTMIDRLWRLWQLRHPSASMAQNLASLVMQPFNLTAERTLDVTALGYDYALSSTNVPVTDGGTVDGGTPDAGTADAGGIDAGTGDAGTTEGDATDSSGTGDAGTGDAGTGEGSGDWPGEGQPPDEGEQPPVGDFPDPPDDERIA